MRNTRALTMIGVALFLALAAVVVAAVHAATNLALGAYVLATGAWWLL